MRETDYVSAACALVPRALFLRHGMFDLHFSPGYYEDTDLAFTVRHTPHSASLHPLRLHPLRLL